MYNSKILETRCPCCGDWADILCTEVWDDTGHYWVTNDNCEKCAPTQDTHD